MAKKNQQEDTRTQEEINQISEIIDHVVWIKGLAPLNNRDFVNAIYKYQDKFTPTTVSAAYWYVCDTYGDYDEKLLTRHIVRKAETITKGIFNAMLGRYCEEWPEGEFRKLTKHFIANFSQWQEADDAIRKYGVNNFDQLMALLPHLQDSSSPVFKRGTL